MTLIEYLETHYITKEKLLSLSTISEKELGRCQKRKLMPAASYKLNLSVHSQSYTGQFEECYEVEYYPRGYASWLRTVFVFDNQEQAFALFSSQYISSIEALKDNGHFSAASVVADKLDVHLKEEWKHFLEGTYGLCTITGLPEEIAAKEVAIIDIESLLKLGVSNKSQLERLRLAVSLLDKVASQFAPHERSASSRVRYVDEVKARFKL
ncbi:DUF6058 family natural product biosynthesis protein [Vibrio splendidus]